MAEEIDCPSGGCGGADTDTSNTDTEEVTVLATLCPFKHKLCVMSDGTVSIEEREPALADGTYNNITIIDGCVASLTQAASPGYTPTACCSGGATTSEGGDYPGLSSLPANLTTLSGGQLLTAVSLVDSNNAAISGKGTPTDPFVIPVTESATDVAVSNAGSAISLTGNGTASSPLTATHAPSTLSAGTHSGITVDQYGHVTAVDISTASDFEPTSTDQTISILPSGSATNFTLPTKHGGAQVTFLGQTVQISPQGLVTSVTGTAQSAATTTVAYKKADDTTGTMTFVDGLLTGAT